MTTASSALLPDPSFLGLSSAHYPEWRPVQEQAIEWLLAHQGVRVKGLNMPVSSGKSLVAAAYAALTGQRTAILVGTRSLQAQYQESLAQTCDGAVSMWADLRGQANYQCLRDGPWSKVTVEEGACKVGMECLLRVQGCTYHGQGGAVEEAGSADVVVLNYAA